MSHRLTLAVCALALLLPSACRKRNRDAAGQATPGTDASPAASAPAAPPAPPKDVPPETALHFLNDAVRNYYAEKQKMPASLEDLYAAGYLKERYNPPPGRRFIINPQSQAVELR